jgi:hypothetical protein
MPLYRVQCEIAMASGVPEDKAVNTWHCIADDLTNLDLFLTQLTTFYSSSDDKFSSLVATSGHRIRAYDLADLKPRAPVRDIPLSGITAVGSSTLPPEIALVVSFQGPQQSGIPQARRRGRIYFGPLTGLMNTTSGRPGGAPYTGLVSAVQTLLDASQAATTWAWAVYSPTNDTAIEVTSAWVDDEFDVQRRRGRQRTTRTLLT